MQIILAQFQTKILQNYIHTYDEGREMEKEMKQVRLEKRKRGTPQVSHMRYW